MNGIAGVKGRTPIGATISISRRLKARGAPMEKKGFHFLAAREDQGLKPQHPRYHAFNTAPWEHRQTLSGVLVHAAESECFEWHRKAQIISGLSMHPHKAPHCTGDGVSARRWSGKDADDFLEIQCLNDKCEFAQGSPPPCKPWFRFVFLATPKGLPPVLGQLTSQSWNSLQNFVGFFDYIRSSAAGIGVTNYSLMGFPFQLQHSYQTQPEKNRRYQVIRIVQEVEPVEFFWKQSERIKEIQSNYGACEALTDQSQQEPGVIHEQYKDVSWGGK